MNKDDLGRRGGGPTTAQSLGEYGRGIAGGLLFSLPILYTQEVLNLGASASSERLMLALAFTGLLLLGYNRFAGLRRDASWAEVAIDSVEELGVGLLLSTLLLWLLGHIHQQMPLQEVMGLVILESMAVAVGVSVGTAQLGSSEEGTDPREDQGTADEAGNFHRLSSIVVLSACGAFLIGANIAATQEVVRVGSQVGALKLTGIVIFSLLIGAVILHYSDFIGTTARKAGEQFWRVAGEVSLTYVVALLTMGLVLWFFGWFEGAALPMKLAYTIVAGLPGVLGASAGRLLLQA